MIKISELTFSAHLTAHRTDRLATIKQVGFGQVIKEQWYTNTYHCLTDTGVVLVVDPIKKLCVTAYFINEWELAKLYHGKVPKPIQRRVSKNIAAGLVNFHGRAVR